MEDGDLSFTQGQSRALSIATRAAASISCVCACYMAVKAFQSRDRMYHRIMLGLSLHLIVYSAWFIYGPAAVPSDHSDVIMGAKGTIQTCSAQGFFVQVGFAIPFYYSSLSLYSFQAVRYNFDVTKYQWIEKWIHICVHIFPVGSAIYLLYLEAFNPSAHYECWIATVPLGCGEDSGIECERGPDNIVQIAWIFAGLPSFIFLLLPTVVMVALYLLVRRRQRSLHTTTTTTTTTTPTSNSSSTLSMKNVVDATNHDDATSTIVPQPQPQPQPYYPWDSKLVAKQATFYLLGLYWTYIFPMINHSLQWFQGTKIFAIAFLSVLNVNLVGVWILLIYQYFRVVVNICPSKSSLLLLKSDDDDDDDDAGDGGATCTLITTTNDEDPTMRTKEEEEEKENENVDKTIIIHRPLTSSSSSEEHNMDHNIIVCTASSSSRRRSSTSRGSFNIFDGTNASGPFAQYIYEGDSEDEAQDEEQTEQWNGAVQAHV